MEWSDLARMQGAVRVIQASRLDFDSNKDIIKTVPNQFLLNNQSSHSVQQIQYYLQYPEMSNTDHYPSLLQHGVVPDVLTLPDKVSYSLTIK